ncbi:hypothetical protein [Streptomyces sp. P9-A4]|uniref:hypothetical protein n=1 Tax=Streptomyces sp. P9-A4 TaxID=3072285 RepID=UPI003FCE7D75
MPELIAGATVHASPVAFDCSGIDGTAHLDVVHTAQATPTWLDHFISGHSAYGLVLFAWWRARNQGLRGPPGHSPYR